MSEDDGAPSGAQVGLLDRLIPRALHDDPENLRQGRLVVGACLMVGVFSVGLAGGRFVLDSPPSLVGWTVLTMAGAAFALLGLFQRVPRPAVVGTFLTSAGMIGTSTMAFMEGGLFSEGLYWALFVPLLTALFSGSRGAWSLAALGTTLMSGLLFLHLDGHDFGKGSAEPTALFLHHMGLVGALWFGAYIGGLFERNRMSALESQRDTEARAARLKDELISIVSHELRTPLTAIRGGLGLLSSGKVGEFKEEANSLIELSLRNAVRLDSLIGDLLDVQKMERGGMEFHFERVALEAALADAAELNLGYAQRSGVGLKVLLPVPGVHLNVDQGRLQQILANLVSNAIKYSPDQATVELCAHISGAKVHIDVIDHGPGVPEEARAMIFERFRQADASDRRSKAGTGLGLHIAQGLAQRMHGQIVLRSTLGEGTTFTLQLPAA